MRFTELVDSNNIPLDRIKMYSTFMKFAKNNNKVLFVTPSDEENENSDLSVKVETF